jgi:predicted LPLAT superfamily acyltransferase
VAVEPPLEMKSSSTSKAVEQAASQYAAGLEPYVLQYPGQWRGWFHL